MAFLEANKIIKEKRNDQHHTPISYNSDGLQIRLEDSWCALGDVAAFKDPIQNDGKLQVPESILVKSKIPGVLERPSNFTLIWKTNSVSIYQMEAPVGYTCLGGIARSRAGIERLSVYNLHTSLCTNILFDTYNSLFNTCTVNFGHNYLQSLE